VELSLTAQQARGGNGHFDEYAVERYLRDVRVATLYGETIQIRKLTIGRHLESRSCIDDISR
jgi:alkylation response protein AidB-like acyl-CoA dehydrogenase